MIDFESIAPSQVGLSTERLSRVESFVNSEISRRRMPGAVLGIVREGKLAHLKAYGWRDPSTRVPMTADTLFWAASLTKPVTTVAALILLEEGLLRLGDPLSRYLPQFCDMQVAELRTDSRGLEILNLIPAERQPTVLDLMRHTSGIILGQLFAAGGVGGSMGLVHQMYDAAVGNGINRPMTGAEFLERLGQLPLLHHPGTVWHYSLGLDVLGFVIEAVSGRRLGDFMRERIFDPLGMVDTSFELRPEDASRYAGILATDPITGAPQELPDLAALRFHSGGAGLISTVEDYLRFGLMLLNGGVLGNVRILGRKTVEYMTSNHLARSVTNLIERADPSLAGYGFGLGVAVRTRIEQTVILGSTGDFTWVGASGAQWWSDPQEDLVVVFMAHTPGPLRWEYRPTIKALVMQAIQN
jgi:CubicO group peptidase (beta-lactamase class C family)